MIRKCSGVAPLWSEANWLAQQAPGPGAAFVGNQMRWIYKEEYFWQPKPVTWSLGWQGVCV